MSGSRDDGSPTLDEGAVPDDESPASDGAGSAPDGAGTALGAEAPEPAETAAVEKTSTSAVGRWLRRGAVGLVVGAMLVAAGALWWRTPPDLSPWRDGAPSTWATREQQLQEWRETGRDAEIRFQYEPLSRIPVDVQVAVLVGEDINFFGHGGIDTEAIREALGEWWAGERLRGASTVTQQLAKNLLLSHRRSWLRKLREARLAWWLERELGKRRILELYLNVIEFDEGVLGVGAAAWHYYGKPCSRLTAEEAAGLAAAIPAPTRSNPATATRAWENRRSIIRERMRDVDWLRRRLSSLG